MAETVEELKKRLLLYEQNGAAKLYYALNRKMNEMADMLNNHNLGTLDVDDAKSKTFDRLKSIWNDAEGIAKGTEALGKLAKVTGNQGEDINNKPFVDTIAQSRT